MPLPINIDDLLHGRSVESERLEFKKGWNPEVVIRTMCAFANDFNNWGGGYIIIGIDENDGKPVFPPEGLQQNQLDPIQKEVTSLGHRLSPNYFPICVPYLFMGQHILVLWCPAGEIRPYSAPDTFQKGAPYSKYIRIGSTTVKAKGEALRQLDEMSVRVPFDDRVNQQATLNDLDLATIQAYLQEIKSNLFEESINMPLAELCTSMQIARGINENIRPLNVGLLFFNKEPEKFFPRAWIEVVWHKGESFTEHYFTGQLHKQLRDALSFIKTNIIAEKVVKHPDRAEADRFYNFPYTAVEEVLANAVYHKSYELRDPIEVQIYPDRINILSFPAAIPPVTGEMLNANSIPYFRFYRNRRIGDFLKELQLTEGRATGLPAIHKAMNKNGSPAPIFDTDNSTYFMVTLHIHPMYIEQQSDQVANQAKDPVKEHLFSSLDELIGFTSGTKDLPKDLPKDLLSKEAKILLELTVHDKVKEILLFSESYKTREEILRNLGLVKKSKHKIKFIDPLLEIGWIEMKHPDKINHPDQGYRITESGKRLLELIRN